MTRREGVLLCSSLCASKLAEQRRPQPNLPKVEPPGNFASQIRSQDVIGSLTQGQVQSSWRPKEGPTVPQPGAGRYIPNQVNELRPWQPLLHAKTYPSQNPEMVPRHQEDQERSFTPTNPYTHNYNNYPGSEQASQPSHLLHSLPGVKQQRHVQFAADRRQGEGGERLGKEDYDYGNADSPDPGSGSSSPYHSRQSSYSTIV